MMKILRRDTAAEIRKTTDAASLAAAKLVTLREERRKLLVEADVEAIAPVDGQIAAQERLIATLQECLEALQTQLRKERQASRVEEKERAVEAFAKEYRSKRVDSALAVIGALAKAGDAYAHYREVRDEPFRKFWRTDLFPDLIPATAKAGH
jgi:hypothetical protein